jgi:anti-sigma-K factor RskA
MRCQQVSDAIDQNPLGRLDRDLSMAIQAHCEGCAECQGQLDGAAVATSLIKARASQQIEPLPFFQTRVLAAIRDRAAVTVRWSAEKMWMSARTTIASMVAVVVILLALNLFAPRPTDDPVAGDTGRNGYSVERVVMEDNNAGSGESLTSGQVLDTVFASGDSYGID